MRALVLAALLAGCGGGVGLCDVDALLDAEAREGAVDCGTSPVGEPERVQACMAEAFGAGQRFRGVVQELAPDDTLVVRAFAGDGVEVTLLLGSFFACGEAGCRGVVFRHACGDPQVVGEPGAERLVCGSVEGCGEQVCGEGSADCGG